MKTLLVIRERLIHFYEKHEVYITPILKFLLTAVILTVINGNIGYMYQLENPAIVIILALLCSFLPYNTIVVLSGAFVVLHLYTLALECALVVLVMFLLMFLLYFRFSPKDTFAVLLTPVCFALRIPYVMPLSMGFVSTPFSVVSVGCGTVTYYVLNYIKANSNVLGNTEVEGTAQKLKMIIDNALNNKLMLVVLASFTLCILLVYLIRRSSVDHSWKIALIAGAVVNVLVLLIGDIMMDLNVEIFSMIVGTLVSVAIVLVLQFFLFNVDYSRTEYVQFEDDEYYYYVKAVPKMTVAEPEVKVKRINPQNKNVRTDMRNSGKLERGTRR